MELGLPYMVEYFPPNVIRYCKKCRKRFTEGSVRIAAMVQSLRFDGKDPTWFHEDCFFQCHQPKVSDEFENFENIKYDDQLRILMRIDPKFTKMATKRAAEEPLDPDDISNYGIEYSTTNDDKCAVCKEEILRNEIKIKKTVYDTEIADQFGKEIQLNHMHCFVMQRDLFKFQFGGNKLPGFSSLQAAHQVYISEVLPSLVTIDLSDDQQQKNKQLKESNIERPSDNDTTDDMTLEETIAKQNAELMRVRQALKKVCTEQELQLLLTFNESGHVGNIENLLDRCADFLSFGALYKCQKCFNGDMIFSKHGYTCNATVDEWVMCGYFDDKPLRLKCCIPDELKLKEFFATCEPAVSNRAVRPNVLKYEEVQEQFDVPRSSTSIQQNKKIQEGSKLKVKSIKLKAGLAVDPKSKLENVAHVYKTDNCVYTCVLGLTDITKNLNSYYKLQVLEADVQSVHKKFWFFSSLGRIGTNIGTCKVEPLGYADTACGKFEKLYLEQTGNIWNSPKAFKRVPGKFYPIEVDYNDDVAANTSIQSKLSKQVEELMKLLFDLKNMKTTMKEFHLDLEKMPLGKLSIKQLQGAYFALSEIEDSLNKRGSKLELVCLSNKFYTLVPHNFGLAKAPIIDTTEKINEKREMVDSLLDIQSAFEMMTKGGANADMNSFDAYYKQLNADIRLLDRSSQEFSIIDQYTRNTQAHGYKIEILEVFKVNRQGEDQRYEPFKDLHNRLLLWHGSRLTNFASIISNGLKISAQVNGSMFGRGIYFADMISKSANYCFPPLGTPCPQSDDVILVLCEVALGNMHQLYQASNIVNLPPGKHSVKGIGQTVPDPLHVHTRPDGVVIPFGKPTRYNNNTTQHYSVTNTTQLFNVITPLQQPGLLFNEYIVYNEAQVKIQYVVKVKIG